RLIKLKIVRHPQGLFQETRKTGHEAFGHRRMKRGRIITRDAAEATISERRMLADARTRLTVFNLQFGRIHPYMAAATP
ncbi:MAG TPA: hypothetical protein PKA57_14825, partial [Parvibaculum sp.]|uniref:hypothetical protein n=1 Tax=Parvibaculum sp. TaxID=2024848 RepID=UPI002B67E84A